MYSTVSFQHKFSNKHNRIFAGSDCHAVCSSQARGLFREGQTEGARFITKDVQQLIQHQVAAAGCVFGVWGLCSGNAYLPFSNQEQWSKFWCLSWSVYMFQGKQR